MKDLWNENDGMDYLMKSYRDARKRLILLDFDGTLVDLVSNPADAVPSEELSARLTRLSQVPENKLIIITGRRHNDIEQKVGQLPIDLIAEHGAMIRENGSWKTLLDGGVNWKQEVYPVFTNFTLRTPYSVMEEKNHAIAWHYRNVDPETGITESRALIEALQEPAQKFDLKIIDGNKIVELIDKKINKGLAANFLAARNAYDFILSMGDDKTDEDMFEALRSNKHAFTIKIGNGASVAKFKLHTVKQVNILLENLL